MYSLRAMSRDCEMYEMDTNEFLSQVRNKGKYHELAEFCKKHD